jgi:hypothetical protein
MHIVDDMRDMPISHFEPSYGVGPPIASGFAQHEDCQLAVHFGYRQSPRHCLAFIVSEIWGFVDGSGEAVHDAKLCVRANEFAQPVPITLIEAVDVEMQET